MGGGRKRRRRKDGEGGELKLLLLLLMLPLLLSICLKKVPAISSTAGLVADPVQAEWLEAVCDCHLHSEKS